jgi:hypothetical protein
LEGEAYLDVFRGILDLELVTLAPVVPKEKVIFFILSLFSK